MSQSNEPRTSSTRKAKPFEPFEATRLFEAKLLHRIDQGLRTRLPEPWQALEAPAGGQRAAAAVLLRISHQASWKKMADEASKVAQRATKRREDSQRDSEPLWTEVARLLESLDSVGEQDSSDQEPPGADLTRLELWQHFDPRLLLRTQSAFGAAAPTPEVSCQFLTALARCLLCARARHWIEEAARLEAETRDDRGTTRPVSGEETTS